MPLQAAALAFPAPASVAAEGIAVPDMGLADEG